MGVIVTARDHSALLPRRILVPVDFSECSGQALSYAVHFAESLGATLSVLHVIASPPYVPLDLAVWGKAHQSFAEQLGSELASFVTKIAGAHRVEVSRRVDTGTPYESILDASKAADLVIIGTHGRTRMSRVLLGSIAERVVRGAACPVLTVRQAP